MEFKKYMHIERFGTEEVEGIEFGECLVFPKLDGSNGSVWLDDEGQIQAGSRNQQLTPDKTNQGFYTFVQDNARLKAYLKEHSNHRLFGEWLVPHSLKTYRDEAWRRFYIFDVSIEKEGFEELLPYDNYYEELERHDLDYIIPICRVTNANEETFRKSLDKNWFLIGDGEGVGEGIVIKNYEYKNKYGRQTWAKIVRNEFKEQNTKAFGVNEIKAKTLVEQEIVDKYCTTAFIEKEFNKIRTDHGGWRSEFIPQLLGRVYHELIKEESWNFVKEFKNPTINFKTLNNLTVQKVKVVKKELFC